MTLGEIQRTRRAVQLDSLTGIRAIAAFLVFWHHANGLYGGISSGMVGVSLFYILSGFVMAWVDRDGDTAGQFYRRRFARIYPAYAVSVTAAIGYTVATTGFSAVSLVPYTLMQSWVPNDQVHFAASAVFWSLSCEAFFYLTFPLLRAVVRALTVRGLWALAAGAGAVSLVIASVGTAFPVTPELTWAVVVLPASRLPEFVIGVCLGAIMARGWVPRIPLAAAGALALLAVVAAMVVPYALSRYAVTLVPFAILVVALASADLRGLPAFTRAPWMVKLGAWSYCFYLVHLLAIMLVVSVSGRIGLPLWAVIPASLAAGLVGAWLLHRFVEVKAERRLRPKGRPRLDIDATA